MLQVSYGYDGLERMSVRTTQNMMPTGTTHDIHHRAGPCRWKMDYSIQSACRRFEYK